MVDIEKQANAALIEWSRNFAVTSRAMWPGHAGIYGQFRNWLSGEMIAQKLGMAVMFPSKADLEFHAQVSGWVVSPVGNSGEAVSIRTPFNNEQVWVRARSENYRNALMIPYGHLRNQASPGLHRVSHDVLLKVATSVRNHELREDLNDTDRDEVAKVLEDRADAHNTAAAAFEASKKLVAGSELLSEEEQTNAQATAAATFKASDELLAGLDFLLDVDHIFSSKSVEFLTDAWVMVFPVPAHANRRYGSKVERYYKKLSPESAARDISSELLFKVLAGMIPDTTAQLAEALSRVRRDLNSFGLSREKVDESIARMESVMKNILKLDRVKKRRSRRPPSKGVRKNKQASQSN